MNVRILHVTVWVMLVINFILLSVNMWNLISVRAAYDTIRMIDCGKASGSL